MSKKTTIIIANHNYGHYIHDAIHSCYKQTCIPSQICIINNGCIDNSIDVIKSFFDDRIPLKEGVFNGIDVISQLQEKTTLTVLNIPKPVGPSFSRNVGIEFTKNDTDIYGILDADDIMYPHKVEKCVQKLNHWTNVGVVYADYDILNVDTGTILREYKEPFVRQRLLQECIVHSGAFIKQSVLLDKVEETGYYDNRLRCAEDYDLWLRIAEKYIISHIPESLSLVRVHSKNSTNDVHKEIWNQCWQLVGNKLRARNSR